MLFTLFSKIHHNHRDLTVGLFSFLTLLALTGCLAIEDEAVSDKNKQHVTEPLHLQNITHLLNSDDVKPTLVKAHPVTATYNREAVIPPMCYTKTEGTHNPCYVCHQNAIPERENVMNDGDLQAQYSFSDMGLTNRWHNLFEDRQTVMNKISDEAIIKWVNQDNYSDLASRLKQADYVGWIPDLVDLQLGKAAFDEHGFAKDGSGWVAFNYKPFPSTFWPTNGSTDDVMIKLPTAFQTNVRGEFVLDIYKANLAILEANIKGVKRITSLAIDERQVGYDLNNDNVFSVINEITSTERYVGAASEQFIDTHLYPAGTEFLHSVRYLGFDENDNVTISTRMKELRYMKKWRTYPKASLARYYQEEAFDKEAGNLPGFTQLGDHGLDNDMGWSVQGFVENKQGKLRVATYEETLFCMGCHSSIGSTIDKTFSFARKVDGEQGWGYINLKGMPDAPSQLLNTVNTSLTAERTAHMKGEFATYFERAGGGDEFRSNPEMQAKWFNSDGTVNFEALKGADVYQLITPSKQRALQLNKAYKVIVDEQSFIFGRDARLAPPVNLYQQINNETSPTLNEQYIYEYDIRLDWPVISLVNRQKD